MSLDTIKAIVIDELNAVEEEIHAATQSDVILVRDIVQHIMKNGKRIRPLLALLACASFDQPNKNHILLASIVEFILHPPRFLHDDVVDNSEMRRGTSTANQLWGNDASVLVGDYLYSRAFQQLVTMNEHSLMVILAETMNIMAEGEVLQLMHKHNINIDDIIYFRVINAKTAVLFSATCEMAATLTNASPELVRHSANFGRHIGLSFQLIDDALDYTGDATQLGKNIGDDLAEGKMTLPLIHALTHANDAQKQQLHEIIATGNINNMDTVKKMIDQHNSVEYTLQLARDHQALALEALKHFPASIYTTAISKLTEFILNRHY
ncbi:MAG: polyprenyl synthetase family protein [Gammaproteobacteria bacterium]|nr:polyprenyl synthetase family protein [Gammaproteobacteria bacterium]